MKAQDAAVDSVELVFDIADWHVATITRPAAAFAHERLRRLMCRQATARKLWQIFYGADLLTA
jgi:hypothetical protein